MIASQNSKERIDILERDTERNRFGESESLGYKLVKTTAAEEMYISGKEKTENDQLTAIRKVKFRIRYFRGVDETMLIRYYDEIYDIRAINHHKRKDTFIYAERGKE